MHYIGAQGTEAAPLPEIKGFLCGRIFLHLPQFPVQGFFHPIVGGRVFNPGEAVPFRQRQGHRGSERLAGALHRLGQTPDEAGG
jgi:hypothetical protein